MPEIHQDHSHRNLEIEEEPLDAANQSLSDALRSSFSVLKGIMAVIVVLFFFSNVKGIQGHEEALVLRMGKLSRVVNQAGLVWAMPFPIDEIIPLPTKKSNQLRVDSHTFHRRDNEIGKPLSFISRGHSQGLDPSRDGALLTADVNLVHMRWKVTYKIINLRDYVSSVYGQDLDAAEDLLKVMVETIGVQLASELTADEMIRTRYDLVQAEMEARINERLINLGCGISVTQIEMYEPTPPIQVRAAFDATQKAENTRDRIIQNALKEKSRILNEVAGAAHHAISRVIEQLDQAKAAGEDTTPFQHELDELLMNDAEGVAGKRINDAGAYRAVVVSEMEADVARYRALLPEYKRNPSVLINRLWEEAKAKLYANDGVNKIFRPTGMKEFHIWISPDPEQQRIAEERFLQNKDFDVKKLLPQHLRPLGPEYE